MTTDELNQLRGLIDGAGGEEGARRMASIELITQRRANRRREAPSGLSAGLWRHAQSEEI